MSWTRVAIKKDIPPASGRVFPRPGDIDIGIFHLSDGRVLAISNLCPHRRGPLSEGIVSGSRIFCPLHDWKIDLVTGQVHEPDHGCVKTFPVKLEGEWIWVDC